MPGAWSTCSSTGYATAQPRRSDTDGLDLGMRGSEAHPVQTKAAMAECAASIDAARLSAIQAFGPHDGDVGDAEEAEQALQVGLLMVEAPPIGVSAP